MRMALSPKGSEPVTDHNVESKMFAQPKIMAQISVEAENKLFDFAIFAIAVLLLLISITYCIC